MNKSVLATLIGSLGFSIGRMGKAAAAAVGIKDTRTSKNTRRHASTKPKYNFVKRDGDGRGFFLNLHTNQLESHPIKRDGLSRGALVHFGFEEGICLNSRR